jgi:hypothetical protein
LRLFSEEVIGVTEWNLLGYKYQYSDLYGVTETLPMRRARLFVQRLNFQ